MNAFLNMRIYEWIKSNWTTILPAIPAIAILLFLICSLLCHVKALLEKCSNVCIGKKPADGESVQEMNIEFANNLRRDSYLNQIPTNRRSDSITSICELRVFESLDNVDIPNNKRSDSIISASAFPVLESFA